MAMENDLAKIPKLKDNENWGIWKFQVRVILNSHNAWEVADGTYECPAALAADANEEARAAHVTSLATWKKADAMVQKVIATSVGQQPMLHIINCTTGREMWRKLTDIYEQRSESSIHMLQQRWYEAAVDSNDNIATYIAKLGDMAHRLNLLGEQIPDSMIITKILMTLPPNFRHFVSAWESTPSAERTLANLSSRLTIEESRTAMHEASEAKAFAARTNDRKHRGKFNRNSSTAVDKCFECNENGHWARHCPKRNKNANSSGGSARNNNENSTGSSKSDSNNKMKPQGQSLISEALSTACGNNVGP